MPRYYFDVRDGDGFLNDEEGTELLDISEAQIEAAATLADLSKDFSMRHPSASGHFLSIEVRDSEGLLFVVGFGLLRRRDGIEARFRP
jgi:hypothetical protein